MPCPQIEKLLPKLYRPISNAAFFLPSEIAPYGIAGSAGISYFPRQVPRPCRFQLVSLVIPVTMDRALPHRRVAPSALNLPRHLTSPKEGPSWRTRCLYIGFISLLPSRFTTSFPSLRWASLF